MKRVYHKPTLEVVAFEVNEAIASCDNALLNNSADIVNCATELGEMWYVTAGINLTGDSNCGVPIYDYCYYTSIDTGSTGLLASS